MKAMLLLFWAMWFSVVSLTNLADGLKHLGILPAGFSFASGNYALIRQVTSIHHTPAFIAALLFAGVVLWEFTAAGLFFRAFAAVRAGRSDVRPEIVRAFTVAAALWGAMMIASEFFISYGIEATHTALLIASLVSFLVIDR